MAIIDSSNLEKLQFYYDHFVKWEKFDEIKQERKERMEELQRILAKDKIDSLTEDELSKAFGKLWSVGVRFQGELVKNNNIEKIRNTLNYLLYDETEEIHTRYEKVSEHPDYNLKMFSDSRISEILIKVRPDYGISLVNKRIVRLVDRLNLHVEYGTSLAEKSKAYDKITKEIQEKFDFKDLDETDMFVWFIDEFPKFFSDEEPLSNSEEFAFIEKDFASTTGIKEDAQYLRNRFKSFQKVLKEKLPEEFSDYKSYVSRVNKRPIPGQEVKYYDIVWMGFAEDKYIEKRVQESIQFQVTVTKEYVSSDIWISFVGKKKITDVKTIIENNKEEFLKIIRQLPSDYFIGAYIRGNEEEREFSSSQVTPKELELILEWMGKSNAEFSIGYWWDKEKVLEFGTNITDEVVGTFEKLAPVYHFINGSKIAQNPTKTMTTNEEYEKFSELLDMKTK